MPRTLEARLKRANRILRDEMRVQEQMWRDAANGKSPSGIPTGPRFFKCGARCAALALKQATETMRRSALRPQKPAKKEKP